MFEIKSNNLGSQNAVCGGGRYDSLVEQLGGESTPAVGFAMGMERLISLLPPREAKKLDVFVVSNFSLFINICKSTFNLLKNCALKA